MINAYGLLLIFILLGLCALILLCVIIMVKLNFRLIRKYGRFCSIPTCKYHNKPRKKDVLLIQRFPKATLISFKERSVNNMEFTICDECKSVIRSYLYLTGEKDGSTR